MPSESSTAIGEIPSVIDGRSLSRPGYTEKATYTEEQKALALSIYAETGSVATAAKDTLIPHSTIQNWITRDPDIDAKLEQMRRVLREQMAHRYAEIAIRAADELLDRVENGDWHYDRAGGASRRPVSASELAYVMSVSGDKHALLTGTMVKQRGEDQALSRLAAKLVSAIEKRSFREMPIINAEAAE